MRKIILIMITIFITLNIYSIEYYARHDDADSNFVKWYGASYRANRYYVSAPCTIYSIEWGRYTRQNEIDTLYIWLDNNGNPGNLLYKKAITINSNRYDSVFTDTLYDDTFIIVNDLFWIGFYSRTQDTPASSSSYFLGDSSGIGNSYYSDDMNIWTLNSQTDYIIRATLYGDSGITLMLDENNHKYIITPKFKKPEIFIKKDSKFLNISVYSQSEMNTINIKIIDIKSGRLIYEIDRSNSLFYDNFILNISDLKLKSSKYLLLININKRYLHKYPFIIINKSVL